MADFLSLYGHNIGSTSGGGGTGGGHEIVNASGTSLPQEDKLQFTGGLKATDDSTNGKTVVDDSATEITFTQWNNMTPEQREAIPKALVTGVPDVDGGIQADLMTLLWENSSPTSSFAAGDVDLSSSDFDFLLIEAISNINFNVKSIVSVFGEKTSPFALNTVYTAPSGTSVTVAIRTASMKDEDTITFSNATLQESGSARTTANQALVPLAIYGIKKTINLEFSAIASNVGTLASNCIADDEVTSMQDVTDSIAPTDTTPATAAHAIGEQFYFNGQLVTATTAIAIGDAIAVGTNCTASDSVTEQIQALKIPESVSVTADGVKTLKTLVNELYALIDSSKVSGRSYLIYQNYVYMLTYLSSGNTYQFTATTIYNQKLYIRRLTPRSGSNSGADTYDGTTYTDLRSSVPTNGDTVTIYY